MNQQPVLVSPLEAHPEYTQALGMISVEIGVLEISLGAMLGAILGISTDVSQIIYMTPQSYSGRLEILKNVTDAAMKPEADGTKKIYEFITRTRARIQYRNDAMHSVWGVKKSDKSVVTRRPVPLLDHRPHVPVPISDLHEQIDKLRGLIAEVEAEIGNIKMHRAALVEQLRAEQQQGLPARRIKGDQPPVNSS